MADRLVIVGFAVLLIIPAEPLAPSCQLEGVTSPTTKLLSSVENFTLNSPLLGVTLALDEIFKVVENAAKLGGVAIPAHVDRTSYSILSNLGFIPPDLNTGAVEITSANREKMENEYKGYTVITDSDAHYLGDISEPIYMLDIKEKTPKGVIESLMAKNFRK